MWRIFFFLSINRTEKLELNLAYLSRREETNYKFSLHYIRAKKNFQKILRREKEKERGEKSKERLFSVVHTQAMRGHGCPACCRPRRLGKMGPDEQLQQNVRWRVEVRGAGMRQSAARQQREILHRGEEEIDHLQHQCKYPKIKFISSFLSLSLSIFLSSYRFTRAFSFRIGLRKTFVLLILIILETKNFNRMFIYIYLLYE